MKGGHQDVLTPAWRHPLKQHSVGHFLPFHHHHPPVYNIKQSTVIVGVLTLTLKSNSNPRMGRELSENWH